MKILQDLSREQILIQLQLFFGLVFRLKIPQQRAVAQQGSVCKKYQEA
jgi:hypothetical protein